MLWKLRDSHFLSRSRWALRLNVFVIFCSFLLKFPSLVFKCFDGLQRGLFARESYQRNGWDLSRRVFLDFVWKSLWNRLKTQRKVKIDNFIDYPFAKWRNFWMWNREFVLVWKIIERRFSMKENCWQCMKNQNINNSQVKGRESFSTLKRVYFRTIAQLWLSEFIFIASIEKLFSPMKTLWKSVKTNHPFHLLEIPFIFLHFDFSRALIEHKVCNFIWISHRILIYKNIELFSQWKENKFSSSLILSRNDTQSSLVRSRVH